MSQWKPARHCAALSLILAGIVFFALPDAWIERWLGLNPDFGAGFTEAAFAGGSLVLGCLLAGDLLVDVMRRRRANWPAKRLAGRRSTGDPG